MTTNFNDKNNFKDIASVRSYQEGGKDFFNQDEKRYFFNVSTAEGARQVGNLLAKIKEAVGTKKKWEAAELNTVINEIEAEKNQNTLAARTLNSDFYLDNALITLGLKHNLIDQPKLTEDERKAKVKELNVNIGDARKKVATNNLKIRRFQADRDNLRNQEALEKRLLGKQGDFFKLLKGDTTTKFNKPDGSGEDTLNNITISIKDYSGNKILKKDGVGTVSKTVDQLIADAKGYLDNLKLAKYDLEVKAYTPLIKSPLMSGLFGERMYNSKNDLLFLIGDLGHSFLRVLKDIGAENLKKIVEKVPSLSDSDKKRLKSYADEITKFIFYTESSHGLSSSEFFDRNKKALVEERFSLFQKSLLKKDPENYDYPYYDIPNWSHIFEFMKYVFPIKDTPTSGDTDWHLLKDLSYFNDPELKPSNGKKGWENLTMYGWEGDVPLAKRSQYFSVYKYATEDPTASSNLKSQATETKKIPDDWTFRDICQLWWNAFIPYMEDPNDKAKNGYSADASKLVAGEINQQKFLEELRFCKTMQEIALKMKIAGQANNFDDILLEISHEARSKAISEKSFKSFASHAVVLPSSIGKTLDKADISISSREYGTFQYNDAVEKYEDLFSQRKGTVSSLESKREILDKQIMALQGENADEQIKIDKWLAELSLLEENEEFENQDLPGKKKMFEDLYNKKDGADRGGKWLFSELRELQARLSKIKEETNDDIAFDTEFKTKSDEIDGLISNAQKASQNIFDWIQLVSAKDTTIVQAIIKLKKAKEEGRSNIGLEEIKAGFEELMKYIKLDVDEQNQYNKIDDAIKNPGNYKDTPPVKTTFDVDSFKAFFKIDAADQTLVKKWESLDKAKVEKVLKDYVVGGTKAPGLISHLNEKGVYDKDNKDSEKKITETDPKKCLEKFLKDNTAEAVIKTILVHSQDDALRIDNPDKAKKVALIKQMRENSAAGYNKDDDTKNTFNKERYGNPTEGKEDDVTREQIVNYLYDEAVGTITKGSAWAEEREEGGGGGTPSEKKPWWKWGGYMAIWLPLILLVAIGAVVIFWKQISEWWNGPTDEEGAGAENKDEDNTEDR